MNAQNIWNKFVEPIGGEDEQATLASVAKMSVLIAGSAAVAVRALVVFGVPVTLSDVATAVNWLAGAARDVIHFVVYDAARLGTPTLSLIAALVALDQIWGRNPAESRAREQIDKLRLTCDALRNES